MALAVNKDVIRLNLKQSLPFSVFALDVGGTLAKIAYIKSTTASGAAENEVELHVATFETEELDQCLKFIKSEMNFHNVNGSTFIPATGVGCKKFKDKIAQTLGVRLATDENELGHAARGLDFLWTHLPPEQLVHDDSDVQGLVFKTSIFNSGITSCVLVNLGSALTIVKLDKEGCISQIVGGSTQGGLTLLGLGSLLTGTTSYHDLIKLAERGDRHNIDLLVMDNAGTDYNSVPPDGLVSSFGKAAKLRGKNPEHRFQSEDVASSLLFCITDQLAQTSYLVAAMQHVNYAIFCGSYLANNTSTIQQIKTKFNQCSQYLKHNVRPIFLKHEAYIGAIGALVENLENHSSSSADSS